MKYKSGIIINGFPLRRQVIYPSGQEGYGIQKNGSSLSLLRN
jgi:hypothetical protein